MIQNEAYLNGLFPCFFNGGDEVNVVLRGVTKQILDNMVEEGYANSYSEAIRFAVLFFGRKELLLDELAVKKLSKLQADVASGKSKTISVKTFAKKHSEFKGMF